jgi:hypothetical protein
MYIVCEKEGSIPASSEPEEVLQKNLEEQYGDRKCEICGNVREPKTGEWTKEEWRGQGDNKEYLVYRHESCVKRTHELWTEIDESFHPTEEEEQAFDRHVRAYKKWTDEQWEKRRRRHYIRQ